MNARTEFQTLLGADGHPAFVVVPYAEFVRLYGFAPGTIPHAVVSAAFAQIEAARRPRKVTLQKVADAPGLSREQLQT
ncbi:hypothetical protein [Amphibiibacter pelophylacis]|uniref:Uncharacterized protein n=1 Tax=Amphibiibacter pelophylacis TaxID=1799477 RepID=A0ACC6NZY9_9BURK